MIQICLSIIFANFISKVGAEGRIKEINAAYECLSDEKKKKTYDLGDKKPFPGFGKFYMENQTGTRLVNGLCLPNF